MQIVLENLALNYCCKKSLTSPCVVTCNYFRVRFMFYKPFRFILYLKIFLTTGEASNPTHKFADRNNFNSQRLNIQNCLNSRTPFRNYFYFNRPPSLSFIWKSLTDDPLRKSRREDEKLPNAIPMLKRAARSDVAINK